MNKMVITKELVVYDSITKEKHTKKMYYVKYDPDTESVYWSSQKKDAKIFTNFYDCQTVANELGHSVEAYESFLDDK